jgi:DHA1 family bicyclomycin/chloramphenicol resistance-like MFS transporter
MMPFPERAGAASSLLGICQMSFAALVGLLTGQLLKGSALPLPALIAAIGLAALAVFAATRRVRVG